MIDKKQMKKFKLISVVDACSFFKVLILCGQEYFSFWFSTDLSGLKIVLFMYLLLEFDGMHMIFMVV